MDISYTAIDKILRNEDIEGLIALGAPQDEYSQMAQSLTNALSEYALSDLTVENTMLIISQVWLQTFNLSDEDMAIRLPAASAIALQLIE